MENITLQPSERQIQDFVTQYQTQLVASKNLYVRYLFKIDKATVYVYTSGNFLAIKRPKKKRHLIGRIVLLLGQMRWEMALILAGSLLWRLL